MAVWVLLIDFERSPMNHLSIPTRKHFSNGFWFWEPSYPKECHKGAFENS